MEVLVEAGEGAKKADRMVKRLREHLPIKGKEKERREN